MVKKVAILFAFVLLLGVPFVGAQDDATPEPEVVTEGESVEVEAGEEVTIDTPAPETEIVITSEEEPGLTDIPNWEVYLLFGLLAAVGVTSIVEKVWGRVLGQKLAPFQPIIVSARDTGMGYLGQYVASTPSVIDDRAFEILATQLGYQIVKKPTDAQG